MKPWGIQCPELRQLACLVHYYSRKAWNSSCHLKSTQNLLSSEMKKLISLTLTSLLNSSSFCQLTFSYHIRTLNSVYINRTIILYICCLFKSIFYSSESLWLNCQHLWLLLFSLYVQLAFPNPTHSISTIFLSFPQSVVILWKRYFGGVSIQLQMTHKLQSLTHRMGSRKLCLSPTPLSIVGWTPDQS